MALTAGTKKKEVSLDLNQAFLVQQRVGDQNSEVDQGLSLTSNNPRFSV